MATHAAAPLSAPCPQALPGIEAPLQLQDCPLLSSQDATDIAAGTLALPCGPFGEPLTLAHLEGQCWWLLLPAPYSDLWRREAEGGAMLYTPDAEHLEGRSGDRVLVVMAQLLWWARWRCKEPIVVTGVKVGWSDVVVGRGGGGAPGRERKFMRGGMSRDWTRRWKGTGHPAQGAVCD